MLSGTGCGSGFMKVDGDQAGDVGDRVAVAGDVFRFASSPSRNVRTFIRLRLVGLAPLATLRSSHSFIAGWRWRKRLHGASRSSSTRRCHISVTGALRERAAPNRAGSGCSSSK